MLDLLEQKRFARSSDKDRVFDALDPKKNFKSGFFQQKADIFMFALALGIKNKKRSKLMDKKSEAIHVSYFSSEQKNYMDMVVLYSKAWDLNSIDKSDEDNVEQMKSILEEYANGGMEIILDKIHMHPENTFDILKILIDEELQSEVPDDIDQDLSWEL